MENKIYEVAIVGGGPAGLSAALYCNRDKIDTILFENMLIGGMINEAAIIENYPGFPESINGYELAIKLTETAEKFGLKTEFAEVNRITKNGDIFNLSTSEGEYKSKAVIIATGSNKKKLNVPGEKEFTGKGVSYCATCDAPFFKNKVIAVIGGGNTALAEAMHLAKYGSQVYLIHRRNAYSATRILIDQINQNKKIEQVFNYKVKSIDGDTQVNKIVLESTIDESIKELNVNAVFIAIGIKPNTEMLEDLLPLEEDKTINTNVKMETRVPGLFAAGDVRFNSIRQIISACGDGAISAISAKNYLG